MNIKQNECRVGLHWLKASIIAEVLCPIVSFVWPICSLDVGDISQITEIMPA